MISAFRYRQPGPPDQIDRSQVVPSQPRVRVVAHSDLPDDYPFPWDLFLLIPIVRLIITITLRLLLILFELPLLLTIFLDLAQDGRRPNPDLRPDTFIPIISARIVVYILVTREIWPVDKRSGRRAVGHREDQGVSGDVFWMVSVPAREGFKC
jgi:hypothetical protein